MAPSDHDDETTTLSTRELPLHCSAVIGYQFVATSYICCQSLRVTSPPL